MEATAAKESSPLLVGAFRVCLEGTNWGKCGKEGKLGAEKWGSCTDVAGERADNAERAERAVCDVSIKELMGCSVLRNTWGGGVVVVLLLLVWSAEEDAEEWVLG